MKKFITMLTIMLFALFSTFAFMQSKTSYDKNDLSYHHVMKKNVSVNVFSNFARIAAIAAVYRDVTAPKITADFPTGNCTACHKIPPGSSSIFKNYATEDINSSMLTNYRRSCLRHNNYKNAKGLVYAGRLRLSAGKGIAWQADRVPPLVIKATV